MEEWRTAIISKAEERSTAFQNTRTLHSWPLVMVAAVAVALSVITTLMVFVGRVEAQSAALQVIAAWGATGVVAFGEYIYRRWIVRAEILSGRLTKANAEVDRLNAVLGSKEHALNEKEEARKTIYDLITALLTEGNNLVADHPKTAEEWEKWKKKRNNFQSVLLPPLRNLLQPHEYARVEVVQFKPNEAFADQFNDDHRKMWHELRARTDALRKLADKYGK